MKEKLGSKKNSNKGQTIIEFVMLLLAMFSISYGFLKITNKGIAGYWKEMVTDIVNTASIDKENINFRN